MKIFLWILGIVTALVIFGVDALLPGLFTIFLHPKKERPDPISRPLLIAGLLWFGMGTVAYFGPHDTGMIVLKYSGIALLMDGLLLLTLSFRDVRPRERNWHIAESLADISFSVLLLLDPIFSLLIFPVIIPPWMAVKGLIKIIGTLARGRHVSLRRGDMLGGLLLLVFSILIPRDPVGGLYSIELLTGVMGWTLGLIYCYDYYRVRQEGQNKKYWL